VDDLIFPSAQSARLIQGLSANLDCNSAVPREQVETARNTAAADWENVKHVALRYGIKIVPIQYS